MTLDSPGIRRREGGTGSLKKVNGYYFSFYKQVNCLTKLSHGYPGVGETHVLSSFGIFSQTMWGWEGK